MLLSKDILTSFLQELRAGISGSSVPIETGKRKKKDRIPSISLQVFEGFMVPRCSDP